MLQDTVGPEALGAWFGETELPERSRTAIAEAGLTVEDALVGADQTVRMELAQALEAFRAVNRGGLHPDHRRVFDAMEGYVGAAFLTVEGLKGDGWQSAVEGWIGRTLTLMNALHGLHGNKVVAKQEKVRAFRERARMHGMVALRAMKPAGPDDEPQTVAMALERAKAQAVPMPVGDVLS